MRVAEQYEPVEGDRTIFATHGGRIHWSKCQWPNVEPGEKKCEGKPLPARAGSLLVFCVEHQQEVDKHRSGEVRSLPTYCPLAENPGHKDCQLCALLDYLALDGAAQAVAGHAMRVANTRGVQAAEPPRCTRCGRLRTLDPCRDCASKDEAKTYPPPLGFTADEIKDTAPL